MADWPEMVVSKMNDIANSFFALFTHLNGCLSPALKLKI